MSGDPPSPPAVFLSYSHDSIEHCDRVLALANRLRGSGINALLDQHHPNPVEGWPRWTEAQLRQADFVVVVCTEIYCRRAAGDETAGVGLGVRWEANLIYQELYNQGSVNRKFLPVLLEGGRREHVPPPLQGTTFYRVDVEADYQALVEHLTGRTGPQKADLGSLPALEPKDRRPGFLVPWNVPFTRNPYFTGREDVLRGLHAALHETGAAALSQARAISGLGGIGKTQTAIEFAWRHRHEYTAVLWVRSETAPDVASGYVELARVLGLPEQDVADQSIIVRAVRHWLETHPGWLVIFDNADRPEVLRPYLPRTDTGHVLVTSRAQVFDSLGIREPLPLQRLPPQEALEFLLRRTGREGTGPEERSAGVELAAQLDFLPLALEQAGAFITAHGSRLRDYLTAYRRRGLKLLSEMGPKTGDYPESVATTWLMNFAEVRKASNASADLLHVCAFLSPDAIPLELFTAGASHLGPALASALADAKADPLALDRVVRPLTEYCLVHRDVEARTLSIHRLVQGVLQDRMRPKTRRQWAERAVRAVDWAFPDPKFPAWAQCDRLLSQARAAADLIDAWAFEFPKAANLIGKAAKYLYHRAVYTEAEPLYQRALAIREKALGPEHPLVATTLNNLGELYRAQEKYAEAEPLYQRALAIYEKALGPEHPDVATTLNNLALLYKAQGKYAEAEALYQRDLAISEKALGPEHPDVATTLNNLANLYWVQEKYVEAEPLYQRAIAIVEKALGPSHPLLALGLENYGGMLKAVGRAAEGEAMLARAAAVRQRHADENRPAPGGTP